MPDGATVDEVIRATADGGCARASSAAYGRTFLRWGKTDCSAHDDDPLATVTEYRALSAIASLHSPEPMSLSWHGDMVVSHLSWIDGSGLDTQHYSIDESVVGQLLEAIQRAHWSGWTHGDVKPSNIIVAPDGAPHLVDWGAACRIGNRALPGTLGYSPPWAWAATYRAAPRNDYYALAITLWEAAFQRRAFSGDRVEILKDQRVFEFPILGDAHPALQELFDVARSGGEVVRRLRVGRKGTLAGARLPAMAAYTQRKRIAAHAAAVNEAIQGGATSQHVVSVGVTNADLPIVCRALVDALRLDHHRNTLQWQDVLAMVRRAVPEQQLSTSCASDQIRRQREAAIAAASRQMHAAGLDAVVTADSEFDDADASMWMSLIQGWKLDPECSPEAPLLVLVHAESMDHSVIGAAVIQDLVSASYCTANLSEMLRASVRRTTHISVADAVANIVHCDATGKFKISSKLLDGVLEGPLHSDAEGAHFAWPSNCNAEPSAGVLDRAEWAAAEGRIGLLIRLCIRLQTNGCYGHTMSDDELVRLADLWAECGRCDASSEVLGHLSSATVASEIRRARYAVQRGDFVEAREALDQVARMSVTAVEAIEIERLSALANVAAGELATAYGTLRSAQRQCRGLTGESRLWLFTTIGNVLRMRGRDWSARRVLRWVASEASSSAGPRLQLAAASNLLIAQSAVRSGEWAAKDAWVLAERCFDLGMSMEGAVNVLTACTALMMAGQPDQARAIIDDVLGAGRLRHIARSSLTVRLHRLRLAAADMSEQWSTFGDDLERSGASWDDPVIDLHVRSLQVELGIVTPRDFAKYVEGIGDRKRWQWLRILVRQATRPRSTRGFAFGAVLALGQALDPWLPSVTHVARVLVRLCHGERRIEELLCAARRAANSSDAAAQAAVSLHVMAVAWRPGLEVTTVDWVAGAIGTDERRRPAGCRLWEWRLMLARCGGMHDASSETTVEPILAALDSSLRRLSRNAARRYLHSGVCPLICDLADIDVGYALSESSEGATYIERVRASLFQRNAMASRGSSRAQGLERVLSGALRLRSAIAEDKLLDEIVSGVRAVCRAERAVVVYEPRGDVKRVRVATENGSCPTPVDRAEVSLTAVEMAVRECRALRFDDACGDEGVGGRPSVMRFRPRSLIVAPLRTLGEVIGYVYVETRSAAKSFSQSDVDLVEGFAAQAALALENARLVSQLRRSCEELERARAEAVREENLRALGRVASEVAHEFSNLLTGIIGETQLIRDSAATEAQSTAFAIIERAALDAASVIARIRETADGRRTEARVELSLGHATRDVIELLRWRTVSDRIHVQVNCDEGLTVRAVPSEFREVVTNVIMNAFDAMPNGGRLCITGTRDNSRAVLEIADSGCGMTEDVRRRALEPFFTTKGERGTGLGLSIAREIMTRHGGEFRIASVLGVGTTVRLILPLTGLTTVSSRRLDTTSVADAGESPRAGGSVLVVDDDVRVTRAIGLMLRHVGIDVVGACDAKSAVHALESMEGRDVTVLTDINMPGVSGYVLAEAIRERGWPYKIVLMTADPAHSREPTGTVSHPILRKPFGLAALLSAIGRDEVAAN